MSIMLNQSPVEFNEELHRYHLGEKRLMGITGLIHAILGLGVYPDANDHLKDYVIPRAGSRGTAVHHAIQTYDALRIRQTRQIVRTRYGCKERGNIRYVDEEWDVTNQLDAYIRHRQGFKPIANEHTVSDNERYASQIDNIWLNEKTGGIWLVDTKTNNLDVYPLCGYFQDDYFPDCETALKEYLSWQLSVYAELFESENPGLKVEGLACNWLREDAAELWEIKRKPSEKVWELLKTTYVFKRTGEAVYFHPNVSAIIGDVPTVQKKELMILPDEVIDLIYTTQKQYDEAKEELDRMNPLLRKAMEDNGIKSWDSGKFKATIAADCETSTFDTMRFKKDHPDLYDQYLVKKAKKGGFTIKNKSDD